MKILEYLLELFDNPKNFIEYVLGVFIMFILISVTSCIILNLMFYFSIITIKN